MGRDVAGLQVNMKSKAVNTKSNGTFSGTIQSSPKSTSEKVENKDFQQEGHDENNPVADESNREQDFNQQSVVDEKLTTYEGDANGTKTSDSGEKFTPQLDNVSSAKAKNIEKSQTKSRLVSKNLLQPNENKYQDDDDNWSLASSAVSVRTVKSRVTVPVAPSFRCMDRAERRKEFYTKLEEKHKTLEREKLEYAARTKEEEEAAIKQLRKSMTYKANPVPNFYREAPPTKVELKKMPVTRAKSPNLSRRKSCGDVTIKTTSDEKEICSRAPRHSIAVFKEGNNNNTIATKSRNNGRNVNGTKEVVNRPQHSRKPAEKSRVVLEQTAGDLAVES